MNDDTSPADLDDDLTAVGTEFALGSLDFEALTPTGFEEFCFDLMLANGFVNVDWRKGTPLASSPADRGRDIVATRLLKDIDGHEYTEQWFVDCKHYKRGVPPDVLHSTISWAGAERPAVVLFIASGYLTNGAKDWIEAHKRNSNPPFRIRTWEKPQLLRLLQGHLDVAFKHNVGTSELRRVSDILELEDEVAQRLWYGRKPQDDDVDNYDWSDDLKKSMLAAKRLVESQFGLEKLEQDVSSQWSWGYLSGHVSALRWVLGDDLNMLDS